MKNVHHARALAVINTILGQAFDDWGWYFELVPLQHWEQQMLFRDLERAGGGEAGAKAMLAGILSRLGRVGYAHAPVVRWPKSESFRVLLPFRVTGWLTAPAGLIGNVTPELAELVRQLVREKQIWTEVPEPVYPEDPSQWQDDPNYWRGVVV